MGPLILPGCCIFSLVCPTFYWSICSGERPKLVLRSQQHALIRAPPDSSRVLHLLAGMPNVFTGVCAVGNIACTGRCLSRPRALAYLPVGMPKSLCGAYVGGHSRSKQTRVHDGVK